MLVVGSEIIIHYWPLILYYRLRNVLLCMCVILQLIIDRTYYCELHCLIEATNIAVYYT